MDNPAILTIGSFLPNKIFGKIPFGRKLDVNVKIMGDALGESKNVLMINVIGKSFTAREKTTRLLVDCISKKANKAAVYIDANEPNVEDAILMWLPYTLEIRNRKISVVIMTLPYTSDMACYKVALKSFDSVISIQVLCADVNDDDPKFMLACLDGADRVKKKWFFIQTDAATDDCTRLLTLYKFVELLRSPDKREKLREHFEKLDSKMMKVRKGASDDEDGDVDDNDDDNSNEEMMKFIDDKLQKMYRFISIFHPLPKELLPRFKYIKETVEESSKRQGRWDTFEAVASRLPNYILFVLAVSYIYRCHF